MLFWESLEAGLLASLAFPIWEWLNHYSHIHAERKWSPKSYKYIVEYLIAEQRDKHTDVLSVR